MKVMLSCGHSSNATDGHWKPTCVICIDADRPVPISVPDLTNRLAKCGCGSTRPSSEWENLAFFEFMGEGSPRALTSCRNCSYHQVAHTPEVRARNAALKCGEFVPHGPYEFDVFYCGCRGFD